MLGASIHIWMMDLGLWIAPRLAVQPPPRPPRPWLGLAVLFLIAAGLVFVGEGAIGTMQALLPHREHRP